MNHNSLIIFVNTIIQVKETDSTDKLKIYENVTRFPITVMHVLF